MWLSVSNVLLSSPRIKELKIKCFHSYSRDKHICSAGEREQSTGFPWLPSEAVGLLVQIGLCQT